jgi:hypothetical protein
MLCNTVDPTSFSIWLSFHPTGCIEGIAGIWIIALQRENGHSEANQTGT